MKKLKYSKEEYEDCEFYGLDEDLCNYSSKVVKIRKEHNCINCDALVEKSNYMLRETAIMEGQGWVSAYTCINCLDKWIDEINGEE